MGYNGPAQSGAVDVRARFQPSNNRNLAMLTSYQAGALGFRLTAQDTAPIHCGMSDDSLILIRARRAEIKAERRRLDTEDAELDQAEKTIVRLASLHPKAKPASNGATPKTQKEFVIFTAEASENPWFESVRALRDAVALKGKDIPMTSFQPLVSQLTADEILRRDEGKVGLASRVDQE